MAEPAQRQQSGVSAKFAAAYLIRMTVTFISYIYWDSSLAVTTTQLLKIPAEKTIQSSNTISRKTHSMARRATQVIFNHKGRI